MRAYTYPGPGLWCALNALTLPRDGVLDVLLSAQTTCGVMLACGRCTGFLAGALARPSP